VIENYSGKSAVSICEEYCFRNAWTLS